MLRYVIELLTSKGGETKWEADNMFCHDEKVSLIPKLEKQRKPWN